MSWLVWNVLKGAKRHWKGSLICIKMSWEVLMLKVFYCLWRKPKNTFTVLVFIEFHTKIMVIYSTFCGAQIEWRLVPSWKVSKKYFCPEDGMQPSETVLSCIIVHLISDPLSSPVFLSFNFYNYFLKFTLLLRWTDRPDCVLLVNGTFSRWDCLRCLGCVTRGPTNGTMSNVQ